MAVNQYSIMSCPVSKEGGKMTKFKVLVSITDVKKFSELVFDILMDKESAQEIESFLSEEFPEEGLQTLRSIARSGYPLSLDGLQ